MIPAALRRSAAPLLLLAAAVTFFAAWLPLLPVLPPLFDGRAFADLADPRLAGLFGRTLGLSAGSAAIALAAGLPLGVLATRVAAPGQGLWRLLLPLPLLLPPLLLAQAWHGLTGMDGPGASRFVLGLCYAPFPALFTARALERQSASAHEAALLAGGRRAALGEMLRTAWPAALLGTALAFLFASTDFAVPDYFAAVGDKFSVYPAEVFNAWRRADLDPSNAAAAYQEGMAVAAPLVALTALVLLVALVLGDRASAEDAGGGRPAPALVPGGPWRLIAVLLGLGLTALLLLAPLARIVFETGAAGPLAEGAWSDRAAAAFREAGERGREDLARSLRTGVLAGGLALLVAPVWAHLLLRLGRGLRARLLQVALALPLIAPAVGLGLGTILVYNRDLFWDFYDGPLLPPLVLAGRFLPVAVFLLLERMRRQPRTQEESAALAGASAAQRLFRYRLGPARGAWLLAGGLVAVFAVRELDLAILIPAANSSAAVRYYNALHFARDNFVAAFGLLIALVLFLPVMIASVLRREPRGVRS